MRSSVQCRGEVVFDVAATIPQVTSRRPQSTEKFLHKKSECVITKSIRASVAREKGKGKRDDGVE